MSFQHLRYSSKEELVGVALAANGKESSTLRHGSIDLATVFDAILTSRQTREKLQCLYENLMSNNFHKTAVLNKISIVNFCKAKDCPKKIWGVPVLKFLQRFV